MSGALHLIPVGLGDAVITRWLPPEVQALAARLDTYIAENAKTARAFLKQTNTIHALSAITIHTLNERTDASQIQTWLTPLHQGVEIGLVSEAGCAAIADPGAKVVEVAHQMGFPVHPQVGPSSLILGLMASGLDGQRFAFHGYAPKDPNARAQQLCAWEHYSARHRQTQLLIETPYRNAALFATLRRCLRASTRLCVARALTTDQEWVMTRSIAEWNQYPAPELDKLPTLFLFLAA
jgi:16S rRNA (cytidine1402-2'-O)-methyltransferase